MTSRALHRNGTPKSAQDSTHVRREVFELPASEQGVRAGLAEIRSFLEAESMDADFCGSAEIVLAEALNNIAEHAYAAAEVGKIRVTLTKSNRALAVEIVDKGIALPGLCPPVGQLPPLGGNCHSLPEGGFGWYLIRALTDCVSYTRHEGVNHLCLRIACPVSGASAARTTR